jgi:hypothetical protein
MTPSLTSFLAAFALAAADLAVLALAVQKLGQARSKGLVLLALAVMLKLAVLVAGVRWISQQAWFDRKGVLLGLLAPFFFFVLWHGLRLQLRHGQQTKR